MCDVGATKWAAVCPHEAAFHVKHPMSAADVAARVPMPPEVLERLAAHLDLLARWQRRINLVGATSLADPWRRHVLDSVQIVPHLPPTPCRILDLGSGAGFPGLALAIATGRRVDLVDSDSRKCAFLREAARLAGADVAVHATRIEALSIPPADVVTARACAPLVRLLDLAVPHLAVGGRCLFLKGRDLDAELTESSKIWMMRVGRIPSLSDPSGTLLLLEDIHRRDDR